MVVIGEDRFERLDLTPAQFRVLVTRRPKLACRAYADVVVQQPAPPRLIEGGIPTEAACACAVGPLRRSPAASVIGPSRSSTFWSNEQGHASVRGRRRRQHDAYSGRQTAPKLYHVLKATGADASSSRLRPCSGARAAARLGGSPESGGAAQAVAMPSMRLAT